MSAYPNFARVVLDAPTSPDKNRNPVLSNTRTTFEGNALIEGEAVFSSKVLIFARKDILPYIASLFDFSTNLFCKSSGSSPTNDLML